MAAVGDGQGELSPRRASQARCLLKLEVHDFSCSIRLVFPCLLGWTVRKGPPSDTKLIQQPPLPAGLQAQALASKLCLLFMLLQNCCPTPRTTATRKSRWMRPTCLS